MTLPEKRKIVLVHGLLQNSLLMRPMAMRLSRRGFDCLCVNYSVHRGVVAENARHIGEKIRRFADGEPVDYAAHSLGGLVLRHLRDQQPGWFESSRVVTFATPHQGSKMGAYLLKRRWSRFLIGKAWVDGIDGNAPAWDEHIPLLSIAGVRSLGLAQIFPAFAKDEINDGTVALAETRLSQAQHHITLNASHTMLPFLSSVADHIAQWCKPAG